MTPVSLPSLRYEPVGPLSAMRVPRLPQFAKTFSPERFDKLPALSKRLRSDEMPEAPQPEWRSSLTPDQAAALAIARQETGYGSSAGNNCKNVWDTPPPGSSTTTTEDWKKARRKEQCRINQANYRKRKRQYEQKVVGEIKVLEKDIEQLQTLHASRVNNGRPNPIQSVGDFYYAIGVKGEKQNNDIQTFQLSDGCSLALQNLMDLQREEFDSVESLKLHWLCYREQFRIFELSIASCERLEAGEHVIIKITGHLQLDVYYDEHGEEGYGAVTCPITQQFEFEMGDQVITRITSEVDLVAGVGAAQDQSAPDCTLSVLRCFSEGFSMLNSCHNI
ncbi:hypothetical protein P3T76_014048 [Phytophthora citrophthora]|uniref:BZIP domain-containing protein n=1 Tax=Phytophthora citrophthora TaxID=4793 RepID=A0AAD9G1S7_9STRA|nr:hypothetical protein P3T76_014048 [Phytophthora citrophthora]